MKCIRFLAAVLLAGLACGPVDHARFEGMAPAYDSAYQEAEEASFEVLRAGGSSVGVALATRDRIVFARGYGKADLAAATPATADTLFPIGSVSKMFAAVAVMQLVDKGLVDLDRPLVQYLPAFRMADPRYTGITVRMLLNHSSGIAGTRYTSAETTVAVPGYAAAVMAGLANQGLKADPGAFAVYCNDGWTLCDPLVAAVGGMSYRDWVKQNIFAPLGMTRSTFSVAPLPAGSYAKAYQSSAAMPQEYVNVDAAGGIYSTTAEMAAFVRMFLDEGRGPGGRQVLSKESIAKMGVDQTSSTFNPVSYKGFTYGLGWDSVAPPGLGQVGVSGWTKNGGTFFYGAQILVAPTEDLAVVVLGPAGGGYSPLAIAERVLLRGLVEKGRLSGFPVPLPQRAEPVATPPAGLAESVAGIYGNYSNAVLIKAQPGGGISMHPLGAGGFPVESASILLYRADGWFTSDLAPLISLKAVDAGGNRYLAIRTVGADKAYLDSQVYTQKLAPRAAALSPAWSARLGRRWLVVNESPDGLPFLMGEDPRFALLALPELPGLLFSLPALPPINMGWQAQVVDVSGSDLAGAMLLRIPGMQGTDMNQLDILVRGGEEWLRWGAYVHRPLETVPALPSARATAVAIGPEGYAEWRTLQLAGSPKSLTLSGARAWRLYDAGFATLDAGGTATKPQLPAGTGTVYLLLFGDPGSTITAAVP